jgi:uncharacterized protein (TIGR03435 family)
MSELSVKMRQAKEDEETYVSSAGRGRLVATRINMLGIVIFLANHLGGPVRDETGLTGFYDFSLEWSDPMSQRPGGGAQPDDSAPDIFRAVQEQLGLKLNATKGPVEILVIDRIERPSEN